MGRDRRNEARRGHFARLDRHMMESAAWRSLSTSAQALFPWLLLEWHGPDHNQNGTLRLSVRQASERLGIGVNAAARAFHDLQRMGFIVVTEPARLGVTGQAKGPGFEITTVALPHLKAPRALFKSWQPGADFPVQLARANNPGGRNGKTKSHHHNGDGSVVKLKTPTRKASPK